MKLASTRPASRNPLSLRACSLMRARRAAGIGLDWEGPNGEFDACHIVERLSDSSRDKVFAGWHQAVRSL